MKREDFVNTFLEGSTLTAAGQDILIKNLVGMVYDLRAKNNAHLDHIEYMDEIARDNDIEMKCRSCGEAYEIPCELSEMSNEGNYCGRSERCCP